MTKTKMYIDSLCGVLIIEEQLRETDEARLTLFQRLLEGGDLSPKDKQLVRSKIAAIKRKWRQSA